MPEVYIPKKGERVEVRITMDVHERPNPMKIDGIADWVQLHLGEQDGPLAEHFVLEVPISPEYHAKYNVQVEIVPVGEASDGE